jgi:DNA-binding NtrC family response regulator
LWREIAGGPPVGAAPPTSLSFDPTLSFRAAKERAVAAWERWYVGELVRQNHHNLSRAARAARMDRTHLRELLRKHGVNASDE